jgi:hypothetical protein
MPSFLTLFNRSYQLFYLFFYCFQLITINIVKLSSFFFRSLRLHVVWGFVVSHRLQTLYCRELGLDNFYGSFFGKMDCTIRLKSACGIGLAIQMTAIAFSVLLYLLSKLNNYKIGQLFWKFLEIMTKRTSISSLFIIFCAI